MYIKLETLKYLDISFDQFEKLTDTSIKNMPINTIFLINADGYNNYLCVKKTSESDYICLFKNKNVEFFKNHHKYYNNPNIIGFFKNYHKNYNNPNIISLINCCNHYIILNSNQLKLYNNILLDLPKWIRCIMYN